MSAVTVGDNWRKARANGYAPTSAACPERRKAQNFGVVGKVSLDDLDLASDPLAILCWPTEANGGRGIPDLERRRVAKLTIAAEAISGKRALAAARIVLERFVVGGGPQCINHYGELVVPLAYDGELLFDERTAGATIACASREGTTAERYRADPGASCTTQRITHVASCLIELSGEWTNGTLLDTPRDRLPKLYRDDVSPLLWALREALEAQEAA